VGSWLVKRHVMSESGLANRDRSKVLRARSVACGHEAGCWDEAWLGRGGEYGGRGYIDRNREEIWWSGSPLCFLTVVRSYPGECVIDSDELTCLPTESPLRRTGSVLGRERHPEYLSRGGALT